MTDDSTGRPAPRQPSPEWLLAVGEATGGVAHDFNNALTAVITRATLIRVTSQEPEVVGHAEAILAAARAARDVVDRIRLLLNPTSTRDHVRVEPAAVIRQAADMVTGRARARGVQVALAVGDSPDVAGIPGELLQLVLNLTTNAVDAANAKVTLRLQGDARGVRVEVVDDGPGISPAIAGSLYEPFVSTKGEGGTGLGLALCRRVVTSHGGTLTLESLPHGGTAAVVFLPPAPATVPRPRRPTTLDLEQLVVSASVLLVDDDHIACDALRILLESAGFQVATAASVSAALERFGEAKPDIVVTDLRLDEAGGPGGWDLIRRLRLRDAIMPIIVVSGEAVTEDASRRGVDLVLRKPINPGTLIHHLRRFAEARRSLSETLGDLPR